MSALQIDLPVRLFEPRVAGEAEWAALHRFVLAMEAEADPEREPATVNEIQGRLLHAPVTTVQQCWVVMDPAGREMVARGEVETWETEDNRHLAWFGIQVLPRYRRQGLGQRLLAPIAGEVRARGRQMLMTATNERIPAGTAFMSRLGAQAVQEVRLSQLVLADLDRELLRRWQEQARERAAGFVLGTWEGRYPEDQLEAIAELYQATNLAPRDGMALEDSVFTPQLLREGDDSLEGRGLSRWSLYAREEATGKLAGFTEVYWHPDQPATVWQGWTAVWPQYRGHGLGRWLKAAMVARVLRERPGVTRIRTDNAGTNAAMLKINYDLGFKPYQTEEMWQVPLERVEAYLADQPG